MRPIVADGVAWSVDRSVTIVSPAGTTVPIEMQLGVLETIIRWGADWRQLANTIEPSVCGGDAALCQITLTTCYH